jgi:hypothetical protein
VTEEIAMTDHSEPTYEIQGKTIRFPVEVRDASGAIAGFVVSSAHARKLVGPAFEPVDFLPGRTMLMLACIDYKDNDLGDYNEVAMNFFVRKRGTRGGIPYLGAWMGVANSSLPSYSWKMPVNQSFTRDAGFEIWGFPKTVERIDFDYSTEGRFAALLEMDGETVFEIEMPRGGDGSRPAAPGIGYSYINGIAHETSFTQTTEEVGAKFGGSGVTLTLGSHPIADDLRALGLPKNPLMTTWVGKMVMSFDPPRKLA